MRKLMFIAIGMLAITTTPAEACRWRHTCCATPIINYWPPYYPICGSTATIVVRLHGLPDNAKVTVDGLPLLTTGPERILITLPLCYGIEYRKTVEVKALVNGKEVTYSSIISVFAGQTTVVDLGSTAPTTTSPS